MDAPQQSETILDSISFVDKSEQENTIIGKHKKTKENRSPLTLALK
jgi:hypothetical protein